MSTDKRKGFTIMIVPHSGDNPLTFTIAPTIIKGLATVLVLLVAASMLGIHTYQIYRAQAEDYQRVLSENCELQDQVLLFADATRQLQAQVEEMQSLDSSIRNMLDLKTSTVLTSEEAVAEDDRYVAALATYALSGRPALITRGLGGTIRETSTQLELLTDIVPQQEDSLEDLEEAVIDHNKRLLATPCIWPTQGRITSPYGSRKSPFGYGYDFHTGIDIGNSNRNPIYATAKGVVQRASYSSGYGRMVLIEHGYGFSTLYAHMYRYVVRPGDKVERGDLIGYVGNTGKSTGPHLHYEVRVNGRARNPVPYLTRQEY